MKEDRAVNNASFNDILLQLEEERIKREGLENERRTPADSPVVRSVPFSSKTSVHPLAVRASKSSSLSRTG
jgi:hypothetical protein